MWSRADEKRAETIRDLRKRTEPDYYDAPDETYWIPYCLSFLSRYPLYNLLGDYLRGMWIHWNKATNLFHAEEVSRILSFPAPRLNDLVRIDMKDYALCYQFPSSPTGFQNFAMWPLFTCLSIPNIVGVIEAAMSPTRRIIFISHYPAMLTVAGESTRLAVRVYEWSGLYVPIVHARHARDLVQEPGPYILGITVECRSLFTAPPDALVVDLDRNFVLTSSPPNVLSASQRSKMIQRLTRSLNGEATPAGVPQHLRSAYGGGKLIPAGQIIIMKGEVESVQDPEWWNQDAVMNVFDHVCEKMVSRPLHQFQASSIIRADFGFQNRNTGPKKLFRGSAKKPLMTKVSMRHLNEIVRERNQYSRDAMEAWQDFINLKGRMDTELAKVSKRNNFLVEELESWKQQFLKFQAFAEQLTKETQDLKVKIENHKRENRRLTSLLDQQKDEATRLSTRLSGTEKQRDDALEALVLQQEIAEELERERKRNQTELGGLQDTNSELIRHRDEAQRVVLHLRALIDGQSHHMEHIVKSLHNAPELSDMFSEVDENGQPKKADSGTMGSIRGALGLGRTPSQSVKGHRSNDSEEGSSSSRTRSNTGQDAPKVVLTDVADRYLRDKTDSITYIIRNISVQCAAAVEGLQLAQRAEGEQGLAAKKPNGLAVSETDVSETADNESTRTERNSIPPTPDLIHHRASTALSSTTDGTIPRESTQPQQDVHTKIANQDEEPSESTDTPTHHDDTTFAKDAAEPAFHDAQIPGAYGTA